MNNQKTLPVKQITFKDFMLKNRRNKIISYLAAAVIIIQFTVFKYLYPHPSFIHNDSFLYLKAADENGAINFFMIGYSRFLRLFSSITSSDTFLVLFQYLFVQSCALFLLFSLFYFYNPRKITQIVLLCFTVINPLLLHLANLISSDCFFTGLSLAWITLLVWIIHRPSMRMILWHTLVLFIAFTMSYKALIYPFITLLAFMLSKLSFPKKLAGMGVTLLVCCLFMLYTGYQYKKLTGTWQYAPFSGWLLANNAMYAYRFVESTDRKPAPAQFQKLDNMIRIYYDTTKNIRKPLLEYLSNGTYYMWHTGLPLMKFLEQQTANDAVAGKLKKWASIAPLYQDYGLFIIKQYPLQFARHFWIPNVRSYFVPPIEYLQLYNSGKFSVTTVAKDWFDYKSNELTLRAKQKINILNFYPILSAMMNIIFLFGLVSFVMLKGLTKNTPLRECIVLITFFWLMDVGFTSLATSAALRLQTFSIFMVTIFSALLIDWMIQFMQSMRQQQLHITRNPETVEDILHHELAH